MRPLVRQLNYVQLAGSYYMLHTVGTQFDTTLLHHTLGVERCIYSSAPGCYHVLLADLASLTWLSVVYTLLTLYYCVCSIIPCVFCTQTRSFKSTICCLVLAQSRHCVDNSTAQTSQ